MRLSRLFVVMLALLALTDCARQAPRYAAAPAGTSELDARMYGAPAAPSYAVRRVAQVVPVAATFDDGPYTLDSGDKLRIVVFGQDAGLREVVLALIADGHVLLEGPPGTAKTLLVRTLAAALDLDTKRLQFTPDLMPGDVTGSLIFDARTAAFEFREGPVFTNLLLADEINRATPKTQAALLEAMQERHVTVAGETRALPRPFLVLATQNPIELEGTYPLPEAQLDRFMFKVTVNPPTAVVLEEILRRTTGGTIPEVPICCSSSQQVAS